MNNLNIDQLKKPLTHLSVAEEQLESALAYLWKAKEPYAPAIDLLQKAMDEDMTVQDALKEVEECRRLVAAAKAGAETTGVLAWRDGLTEGKKEWAQDGYEVRVTETRGPVVVEPRVFLNHVEDELGADSIVKSVKVTVHKKNTVELNERIPLDGLEIEKKTSCSVRRESKGDRAGELAAETA